MLLSEFDLFELDIVVVVVVLQEDLSEGVHGKGRPEVFLDVDETVVGLHQHVVAETRLT